MNKGFRWNDALTTAEVADKLRITRRHAQRIIRGLPHAQVGRRLFVERKTIDRMLADAVREPERAGEP